MTPAELAELQQLAEEVDAIHPGARMPVEAGELLHLLHLVDGYRVALAAAKTRAADAVGYIERNTVEHCCSGADEIDAAAVIAILQGKGDPRDTEHVRCNCVPQYGPPHCHLCTQLDQTPLYRFEPFRSPVEWPCAAEEAKHA